MRAARCRPELKGLPMPISACLRLSRPRPALATAARAVTLATLLAMALPAAAPPAGAQTVQDQAQFDLVMRGITAGSLTFSANQQGEGYSVVGRLASSGLLSLIRRVAYDARAEGMIKDGRYIPARYAETADTGKRTSESQMDYKGGVPQVRVYNPPREPAAWDVDASTQGGTVDPLTALYATLRDVAPGGECNRALQMFDGRRASQLTLGPPQAVAGGAVTCAGEYRRVAGFPPEDMEEKTSFPFTLTYLPGADGRMQVVEVTMDSLYGKARLIRR